MKNSTILIVTGKDASRDDLVNKLETIRTIPAHAVILLVGDLPQFPYYAVGIAPYGGTDVPPEWQEAIARTTEALKARQEEIETLLAEHDVSGEVAFVATEQSEICHAIAQRAMLSDIVLICDDLRGSERLFREVISGVLFQSPVGALLNDPTARTLHQAKRIFVAWNTHLHTARAVHQALPLLRKAEEVIIGLVDPVMNEYVAGEDPGVDAAKWLTRHGCTVTVQQYPSGGRDVGTCLLNRANERGADLIVMGSYGHSRTREAIFGGTTRTLLEQTDQAVFMAR